MPFWPTAARINKANAGKTVLTDEELLVALNEYLDNPDLEKEERHNFVKQELTYLNGESTQVAADTILRLVKEA